MATIVVTPIDLALRSLPAPSHADVLAFVVRGCRFQTTHGSTRAWPVIPGEAACQKLWALELTNDERVNAVSVSQNAGWEYLLTRDYNLEQTRHGVAMTYDNDRVTVSAPAGQLRHLACHDSERWQLLDDLVDAGGLVTTDTDLLRELRRGPACEAEVEIMGQLWRVPVHQEVTLEAGALFGSLLWLAAAPVAMGLTALLRTRFRRRVEQTMQVASVMPAEQAPEPVTAEQTELHLAQVEQPANRQLGALILQRARRAALAFAAAGLVCATALGVAYWLAEAPEKSWRLPVMASVAFAWPLIPIMAATLPVRRRWLAVAALGHLTLYAAVGCGVAGLRVVDALTFLGCECLISLPALVFVSWRWLRGVGPWMLIACWLGLGALVTPYLLFAGPHSPAREQAAKMAVALGVSSAAVTYAASVLMALGIVAPVAWFASRWASAVYRILRINERLVMAGSLWAIHVLVVGLAAAHLGYPEMLWAVLALPVAGLVVVLVGRGRPPEPPLSLLFLRAFEGRKGQADVFASLRSMLAHRMHIELIAGPDLASALIQPDELLDFVAGKLARAYLQTPEAAEARLARRSFSIDAEGLYPLQQFFCANEIWKQVFAYLAARADAVLIDLRGLSKQRSGCAFELTQLIHRVPLVKVLVLTDSRTDLDLLRKVSCEAWSSLPVGSPNAGVPAPSLAVFQYRERAPMELERLVLCVGSLAAHEALHRKDVPAARQSATFLA